MLTAEQLREQDESLSPELRARLDAINARVREKQAYDERRTARRNKEISDDALRGIPAPFSSRLLCPSEAKRDRGFSATSFY